MMMKSKRIMKFCLLLGILLIPLFGMQAFVRFDNLNIESADLTVINSARRVFNGTDAAKKLETEKTLLALIDKYDDKAIKGHIYHLLGDLMRGDKHQYSALKYYRKAIRNYPEFGDPKKSATRSFIVYIYRLIIPDIMYRLCLAVLGIAFVILILLISTIRFTKKDMVMCGILCLSWVIWMTLVMFVYKWMRVPRHPFEEPGLSHFYIFVWIAFFKNPYFFQFLFVGLAVIIITYIFITNQPTGSPVKNRLAFVIFCAELIVLYFVCYYGSKYFKDGVKLYPYLTSFFFEIRNPRIIHLICWSLYSIVLAGALFFIIQLWKKRVINLTVLKSLQLFIITFCLLLLFVRFNYHQSNFSDSFHYYFYADIEDALHEHPEEFINLVIENGEDPELVEFIKAHTTTVDGKDFYLKRKDDVKRNYSWKE